MFSNRFTAFVDACSLADVLRRDLLLTLAAAGFFRLRWSSVVLDEVERSIRRIKAGDKAGDGDTAAADQAARARRAMERAFPEASVDDFDAFLPVCAGLPDPGDAHVVAAAMKAQAAVIVTENLKHFPRELLAPLNMDVRSSDVFLADTIALEPGRAVRAVRMMRERYAKAEMTAPHLLTRMESRGLFETADVLRPHCASL